MPGTKVGGAKASATNKQLYGAEFYKTIGRMGGLAKVPKGFAVRRDLANWRANSSKY